MYRINWLAGFLPSTVSAWQSEKFTLKACVFFSADGKFPAPEIGTFRLDFFLNVRPPKRREDFLNFRWVGPGTKTTFNPFPNTPRSWCAKHMMCLVSPRHCFWSVGAWLIPKKRWFHPENAWTNTGHAVGPNTVHVFLLTKTLVDFVGSKKNLFENNACTTRFAEATVGAGLVYRSVNNAKFDAGHNDEICKPCGQMGRSSCGDFLQAKPGCTTWWRFTKMKRWFCKLWISGEVGLDFEVFFFVKNQLGVLSLQGSR